MHQQRLQPRRLRSAACQCHQKHSGWPRCVRGTQTSNSGSSKLAPCQLTPTGGQTRLNAVKLSASRAEAATEAASSSAVDSSRQRAAVVIVPTSMVGGVRS